MRSARLFRRWRGTHRWVLIGDGCESAELGLPAKVDTETVSSVVYKIEDDRRLAFIGDLGADAVCPGRRREEGEEIRAEGRPDRSEAVRVALGNEVLADLRSAGEVDRRGLVVPADGERAKDQKAKAHCRNGAYDLPFVHRANLVSSIEAWRSSGKPWAAPHPGPLPIEWGEGGFALGVVTQGGARSSLALG